MPQQSIYVACIERLQQALCDGRFADFAAEFAPTASFGYFTSGFGLDNVGDTTSDQAKIAKCAEACMQYVSERELRQRQAYEAEVDRGARYDFEEGVHYMVANFVYAGALTSAPHVAVRAQALVEVSLTDNGQVCFMQLVQTILPA